MKKMGKRVRTPTIIQMEKTECGAACVCIVLAYFGRWIPLEQMRLECGVTRDGSNALNMKKAAENHGLVTRAFQNNTKELEQIECPAILLWRSHHFVILEGISKNTFYLNDPARGHISVPREFFERNYSGFVLTFVKGPSFKKDGKPPSFFKSLIYLAKNAFNSFVFLFFTGLFLLVPGLAIPILMRIFIDDFLVGAHYSWISAFFLFLLLGLVLSALLTSFRQMCLKRLNTRLSIVFSSHFLWHLLRLPISFYSQRYYGEIVYRMTLNDNIARTLTSNLAPACVDLLMTIFYAFCIFLYDVPIGLVSIGILFLNLFFMMTIQKSRDNDFARLQQEFGRMVGVSIGAIQQIDTIKAAGIESPIFSNLAGYFTKNANAYQAIGAKDAYLATLPIFFQSLGISVILSVGAFKIFAGTLSLGMLMALFLLFQNFLGPIGRFVNFGQMFQNMKIELARLQDVLQYKQDYFYNPRKTFPLKKAKLIGKLEVIDISFGYSPLDAPLIDQLKFELVPGKRIALVGPVGCGKSTIAKLCSGLYLPRSGQILYDGMPITAVDPQVFRNSLSTVDQEIFISEGTIWENLTLWDRTLTEEIVIKAAKDAEIHDEILERHNLGYQAPISEGGKNLSAGQRQRIEIARSLIRNPSILLMDEATSLLDSETEKRISDNIRRRGCSCLMIAHRLSTIQDCDEIILLDKGKISDRGTHYELKEKEGIYRNLVLGENRKLI